MTSVNLTHRLFYGRSEIASIIHACASQDRLHSHGIATYAVHPRRCIVMDIPTDWCTCLGGIAHFLARVDTGSEGLVAMVCGELESGRASGGFRGSTGERNGDTSLPESLSYE